VLSKRSKDDKVSKISKVPCDKVELDKFVPCIKDGGGTMVATSVVTRVAIGDVKADIKKRKILLFHQAEQRLFA
jgi:hypothetical protein